MIQSNCRLEKYNGLKFYEQDILFDDYVYNNYIDLSLEVSYCSPGFGIAIINNNGSLNENNEMYLFRIGYRETSIEYKNGYIYRTLFKSTSNVYPNPLENEKININFIKNNKNVYLYVNSDKIIYPNIYKLPYNIEQFNIAIYSNAGNTINSIDAKSYIPDYWNVNMYNTNGGRILFKNNSFNLESCEDNAEVEQYKINLPAGDYYLSYEVSDDCDIKPYVFYSDSPYDNDDVKNIIDEDNHFVITEEYEEINIKFKGKQGTISNIILNNDETSNYVYTTDDSVYIGASSIIVNTETIESIKFRAKILEGNYDVDSYIFKNESNIIMLGQDEIRTYLYNVADSTLTYYDDNSEVDNVVVFDPNTISTIITLFHNIDAIIYEFIITKLDGTEINFIINNILAKNISLKATMPVIVTDKSNIPLNISSAYRIYTKLDDYGNIDKEQDEYVFTNIEREYFEPSNVLKLEYPIYAASNQTNVIKVYGVKESELNFDNFYRVVNSPYEIGLSCNNNYEQIENDYFSISFSGDEVYFNDIDITEYTYIIVDYLKDKSYCLNANYDRDIYSVDISNSNPIQYYYNENDVSFSSNYKVIPFDTLTPVNNSYYVCLRGDA